MLTADREAANADNQPLILPKPAGYKEHAAYAVQRLRTSPLNASHKSPVGHRIPASRAGLGTRAGQRPGPGRDLTGLGRGDPLRLFFVRAPRGRARPAAGKGLPGEQPPAPPPCSPPGAGAWLRCPRAPVGALPPGPPEGPRRRSSLRNSHPPTPQATGHRGGRCRLGCTRGNRAPAVLGLPPDPGAPIRALARRERPDPAAPRRTWRGQRSLRRRKPGPPGTAPDPRCDRSGGSGSPAVAGAGRTRGPAGRGARLPGSVPPSAASGRRRRTPARGQQRLLN